MISITPYQGMVKVLITNPTEQSIHIEIETDNLYISSARESDLQDCVGLYGNRQVMSKILSGATLSETDVRKRIDRAVNRAGTGDPFHMMVVRNKQNEFLGTIVAGHGDEPGVSELAGLGNVEFQNRGYGKEALTALLHGLLPVVKDRPFLDGAPLRCVVATAREDNGPSNRVMQNAGMDFVTLKPSSGALRNFYSIDANDLGLESLRAKTHVVDPRSVTPLNRLIARINLVIHLAVRSLKSVWEKTQLQYNRAAQTICDLFARKPKLQLE